LSTSVSNPESRKLRTPFGKTAAESADNGAKSPLANAADDAMKLRKNAQQTREMRLVALMLNPPKNKNALLSQTVYGYFCSAIQSLEMGRKK
jgi:hypothetical protein